MSKWHFDNYNNGCDNNGVSVGVEAVIISDLMDTAFGLIINVEMAFRQFY